MTKRERPRDLHFYVTEEEFRKMEKKRKEIGIQNRAAFIRKMVLQGFCIKLDLPEIREMTSLLKRCSNNLNQYARKANESGSIYGADVADLKELFEKIYQNTGKILEKLGTL